MKLALILLCCILGRKVSTELHSLAPKGRGWGEGVRTDSVSHRLGPFIPPALLLGNVSALDDRRPFADVALHPGFEFLGRAGLGGDAETGEAGLDVGYGQYFPHRPVQQLDDRLRGS